MKHEPLDEYHDFRLAGVWIPPHVCTLLCTRQLGGPALILYVIIKALQGKDGCYATNAYLAKACGGVNPRKVQEHLNHLKGLALIEQTRFDGRRRFLHVAEQGSDVPKNGTPDVPKNGTPDVPKNGTPDMPIFGTHKEEKQKGDKKKEEKKKKTPPTPPQAGGNENGFGLTPPKRRYHTTQFDIEAAATLEEAVRTLPERVTDIAQSRLSSWPRHIRRLRMKSIPEETIMKVLMWYKDHIGEEFVPRAFDANIFRQRFRAIEAAMHRDPGTIEAGQEAADIAARLTVRTWPMGVAKDVPAAVQAGITAYTEWIQRRKAFVAHLREQGYKGKTNTQADTAVRFGGHLLNIMPPATFFVEHWMERVHERVCAWEGWSGDLMALAFKPNAKEFHNVGRDWSIKYSGCAQYWDDFCAMMDGEWPTKADDEEEPLLHVDVHGKLSEPEPKEKPMTQAEIDAFIYASPFGSR